MNMQTGPLSPARPAPGGEEWPRLLIIGAGMSGILMAIKAREAGISHVTIVEKAASVGGTWRENRYPGLACDVPSHSYSYSFAPNPFWSKRFSEGPEICKYLEDVAADYGLDKKIEFGTEIISTRFENGVWHAAARDGRRFEAEFIVCATGILHHPHKPSIDGLESFAGDAFHTAEWDDSVSLEGKRVGIIGTGSTSAQIVGDITDKVGHLSLFQRTPQWIFPQPHVTYKGWVKRMWAKMPWTQKMIRDIQLWLFRWTFARAVVQEGWQRKLISWITRKHLKMAVKDPVLRDKLTPDYAPACKRLIFSASFYKAIQAPHAALVTEEIERIEPEGVRTKDGTVHPLDVLVLATGFKAHNFMRPMEVLGEGGRSLNAYWAEQTTNFKSVGIPHFPNFFMLNGPGSPIGNFSLIWIAELQVGYILSLIDEAREKGLTSLAPKEAAAKAFQAEVQEGMQSTVWLTGGCSSWYFDANGNLTLWPFTPDRFREEMTSPSLDDYEITRAPVLAAAE
ncbi:MAG: NAD(P)/FAD-dependent oxidoreductase [Pseudomonadota bacterium]